MGGDTGILRFAGRRYLPSPKRPKVPRDHGTSSRDGGDIARSGTLPASLRKCQPPTVTSPVAHDLRVRRQNPALLAVAPEKRRFRRESAPGES
jgi:hypothetical protein